MKIPLVVFAMVGSVLLAPVPMAAEPDAIARDGETPERQVPVELQRAIAALSGSWAITEEYPPSALYPKGGVGRGTEIWRAGPGSIDLVYEYHSTNPSGEMWATAVLWWDLQVKKLRELWCTSRSASGCRLSTADIRWEGGELVFADSYEANGRRRYSREVWSQMDSGAHTMTISESTTNSDFKSQSASTIAQGTSIPASQPGSAAPGAVDP